MAQIVDSDSGGFIFVRPGSAPVVPPLPKFGVCSGDPIVNRARVDMDWELDQIQALGGKMMRLNTNTGNQTALEYLIPAAKQRGIETMLILYPDATQGFVIDSFARDQARKWAGQVNYFEICNEPDMHGWTANGYADFLVTAYDAVKSGNIHAKIIGGALWKGTSPDVANTLAFAQAMITRAPRKFDILSMHLYDDPLQRGSWNIWDGALPWSGGNYNGNTVREKLDAAGMRDIPIIATEGGGALTLGGVANYTETKQATIATNALQQVKDGRIASFLFYNIVPDNPGVTDYGLTRSDRSKRPAWDAYKAQAVT